MLRTQKKELQIIKDNIKNATRVLDNKTPLTDKERYYLIDILIQSNNMIEKLEVEVIKYEDRIEIENRKPI